jgi:hypothetical protein
MAASANAPAPSDAPTGRVPDFFIVGHPKSGTSAMYQMLQAYPQLHMPRKEPSFFVPELRTSRWGRYHNGIDEYTAMFAGASPEQLVGEATTAYLWSQQAARLIARAQPKARIIAILREPASFLRSLHLQFIRSNMETEPDLRRALALEPERRQGRQIPPNAPRPQQLLYSEHVRYVEQLNRYRAVFPREQMLVLIYEDFRADNEGTIKQVLRFLGVEDASPVNAIEANHASAIRSPRAYSLVRSLYLGTAPGAGVVKRSLKALTSRRMRHRAIATTQRMQREEAPVEDPQLMRELRVRFKGEVEALSDHLDRDMVAFWGYEGLG